jgi:hypothetical protein
LGRLQKIDESPSASSAVGSITHTKNWIDLAQSAHIKTKRRVEPGARASVCAYRPTRCGSQANAKNRLNLTPTQVPSGRGPASRNVTTQSVTQLGASRSEAADAGGLRTCLPAVLRSNR